MRSLGRWTLRAVVVVLLFTAVQNAPVTHAPRFVASAVALRADDKPPASCCFSNPGYSGICEVQPTKDESCGTILGYLNNSMSQGKSYCGNTTLRGGWKQVVCGKK